MPERQTITRNDFPDVNKNRFWVVTHNPKSMAKPVTIELREYLTDAAREKKFATLSTLVGFITTTGDKEEFVKAAFELHRRVNDVDLLVGTY